MDINYPRSENKKVSIPNRFPQQYVTEISVFVLALGFTLGGLQLFQRINLDTPWYAYFVSSLLLFCFTGMPILVSRINSISFQNNHSIFLLGCMVWLLMLLSSIIIGVYAVVFFLGAALLIVRCCWDMRLSWRKISILIISGVLFGAYLYLQLHKVVYLNAFTPEFLSQGVPNGKDWMSKDTYMHIAISHMILEQGVASTGLNGLTPAKYHFGSHYFFAILSRIVNVKPAMTYMISYYILVLPIGFYSLLWAARAITSTESNKAFPYIVVCLGFMLTIGTFGLTGYYISESFYVSIIFALWLLPIFLSSTPDTSSTMWAVRLMAICGFFVLYSLKISTGAILAATVFWIIMCFEKRSAIKYFQIVILVLVSLISIYYFYPVSGGMPQGGEGALAHFIHKLNPMNYFFEKPEVMAAASLPALVYWLLWLSNTQLINDKVSIGRGAILADTALILLAGLALFSCFYWPVVREETYRYLGIIFSIAFISILYFLTRPVNALSRHLIASMFIILFSFLPSIIGLVGHNEIWFVYCAIWLTLPILIPRIIEVDWLAGVGRGEGGNNYFKIAFLLLAFVYLGLAAKNVVERLPSWLNRVVYEVPSALHGQKSSTVVPLKITKGIKELLADGPLNRLIEEINHINTKEKRGMVYVSPSLNEFWQSSNRSCFAAGWIVPALTGMPLVFGTPTKSSGCKFPEGFGYGNYDYAPEGDELSVSDICIHVVKKTFKSVYMVYSLDNLKKNKLVNCQGAELSRH